MSDRNTPAPAEHHGIDHLILDDHRWAERVAVTAWIVAGLLFLAMAITPIREAIDSFDLWFHELTFPIKWGPLTAVSKFMAFLGSVYFIWPLRLVVTAVLWFRRRWVALAAWWMAILLSEPLIGTLKAAYGRPRPTESLVVEVTGAFPSGHAVAGAVVALSLVIVLVPRGPARRNLEMAAAAFAVLMAGTRVYLGAHWLTDVFAGVALGAACAIGGAALVQRWFQARSPDPT
ncbi:MAG: phosphatase PAP2 family protein [Acidimicrobiia bacterium]|nr:phosphatase PAP2 family protein [Acidimicrobiia bacterium]